MLKLVYGIAFAAVVFAVPTESRAQKSGDNEIGQVFLEFQLEQPAKLKTGGQPVYPERLRLTGVGGEVIVQFVIDENGRPDMSTFKVIKTSHTDLAESVRRAVAGMFFSPAEANGRKVRELVQQPFTFSAR